MERDVCMGLIKKKARGLFKRSMAARVTAAMMAITMAVLMCVAIVVVTCVMMMPADAYATEIVASGDILGNTRWKIDSSGTLSISGNGEIGQDTRWFIFANGGSTTPGYPWDSYYKIIKRIVIGEGITSIPTYCFLECENAEKIKIASSVTEIECDAFVSSENLRIIKVDNKNAFYSSEGNCLIEKAKKRVILGCANSKIPSGIKTVGGFKYCTSLTSIKIPESVTEIADNAFRWCINLKSVKIPENVTTIGENAFYYCKKLEKVKIPDSVKSIGDSAFSECFNLVGILGYTNSYAEEFAKENNITFKSIGTVYKFSYEDVDDASWYYDSVKNAGQMGLINGVDEAHFKPDANMTYAQAITLAARMHQKYMSGFITLENGSGDEAWYQPYVDYCLENHIIESGFFGGENSGDNTGDSGDNLGGDSGDYSDTMNDTIDRQNYAEIFAKALPDEALAEKNAISDGAIPDVACDNTHYASIYKLYRAGICNGSDASGSFYPEKSIKRSEVAAILVRMMDESARVGAAV